MKIFIFVFTVLVSTSAFANKKVLMMIPNDFMWPEYSVPRSLYEKAGFQITTAGRFKEKIQPDRRNKNDYPESKAIIPDLSFEEVKIENFDAITFVAGNGAWHDFFPNQTVHNLVSMAFEQNKVVGLLCASTGLLGLVGNINGNSEPIAKGKKVVGYFRVEGILRKLGEVDYIPGGDREPGVSIDGTLVTGRNPESSEIFGKAVVQVLSK